MQSKYLMFDKMWFTAICVLYVENNADQFLLKVEKYNKKKNTTVKSRLTESR